MSKELYSNTKHGNAEAIAILGAHKQPRGIEKYIRENLFDNYIIYDGKTDKGFCTKCQKFFDVFDVKHNRDGMCPHCKMAGKYKSKGLRKSMVEYGSILVFFRVGETIHAILQLIKRRTDADWDCILKRGEVPLETTVVAVYSMDQGRQSMYEHGTYFGWASTNSMYIPQYLENWGRVIIHMPSFTKSIKESCLKYAGVEAFYERWRRQPYRASVNAVIRFMAINAKYPQIEYLSKLGFHKVVDSKLCGASTYKALNWNKKNLKEMFGLETNDIKLLQGINASLHQIAIFKRCLKEGWHLTAAELHAVDEAMDINNERSILAQTTVKEWYKYKQKIIRQEKGVNYRVRSDYEDYLKEMKALGYDLTDKYNLFPPDFKKAHERVSKIYRENQQKISEQAVEKEKKRIEKYVAKLKKTYEFEDSNFIIRPATSRQELINEGSILHHCVASYYDSMAAGRSAIFFIRMKSSPDTPFYTLELKDKEIRQCRGTHNSNMTVDVKEFVDRWHKEVVLAKKKRTKAAVEIAIAV